MKSVLTLVLLFGSVAILNAQRISVKDAASMQGIAGVSVSTDSRSVISASDGRFDLSGFTITDTLLIQHLSYYAQFIPYTKAFADGEILLQGKAYSIAPVVISANKWQQNEEVVSDHITVLTPNEIALNNPGTAADLLSSSGEIFVQKSQLGGGSPMIRGFAANRVLLVVDGVRMNNAIYRSGNLQNIINIDPNTIEVAEVIHGPGAITYGSDAIGGVMDFHTYDPVLADDSGSFHFSGAGLARYATATDEQTYHGRFNTGWKRFALNAAISHTSFGDPIMGSDGPDDYLREWYVERINGIDSVVGNSDPQKQIGNAFELDHMLLKLRYQPDAHWNVVLSGRHSETSNAPRYDRLIQTREGEPRSAVWEYGPQKWSMFNLRVEHTQDSGWWNNARLIVAYQDYEESRIDRGYRSDELRTRTEDVSGFWANLDFEKELTSGTQLFYGLEAVTNLVGSSGIVESLSSGASEITNPRYPDGSDWSTGSVYGSITSRLNSKFIFNGGVRFNQTSLNAQFDTTLFPYPETSTSLNAFAFTGSAGLIWLLDSVKRVSLDVSRGFRAPNIDDVGKVFDSEPGAVIIPNTDLEPEYVNSVELGFEARASDRFRMDLSVYYSLLDNAIVRRPYQQNGQDSIQYDGELSQVQALQNAANAEVYGFHLGLHWNFSERWSTELHYNWQDGSEEDDQLNEVPARHVPPAFTNLRLTWEKNRATVSVSADISDGFMFEDLAPSEQNKPHIYAVDGDGNPYSPSWYVIGLRGRYAISDTFSVSGGVENITDQRYRTYSSGVVAPGRNFIISLRVDL
jgi:hemoglobin/transferrin/lactoferrin receptor protein